MTFFIFRVYQFSISVFPSRDFLLSSAQIPSSEVIGSCKINLVLLFLRHRYWDMLPTLHISFQQHSFCNLWPKYYFSAWHWSIREGEASVGCSYWDMLPTLHTSLQQHSFGSLWARYYYSAWLWSIREGEASVSVVLNVLERVWSIHKTPYLKAKQMSVVTNLSVLIRLFSTAFTIHCGIVASISGNRLGCGRGCGSGVWAWA